jgi:hypothetical protein
MTIQRSPKDSGTFTATIADASFVADNVTLHNFAGEKPGGYISGVQGSREIYIGYPDGIGDNNKVTKKYPADFTDFRLNWALIDGPINTSATTGWITVTFTKGMSLAKGEFEFTTDEHPPRKVSGKFDVQG